MGTVNIIRFGGPDDYGVYVIGSRGEFGTPLVTRGSWAKIEGWRDVALADGYELPSPPSEPCCQRPLALP